MYTEFFGLNEKPFSITPDPRYLYLSRRHADALAHLIYGISESGGFIQLTGEVGTGKTTLIRSVLEQLPEKAEIALILNPQLTAREFIENICEELRMPIPAGGSLRALIAALNQHLLDAHAQGRRIVLIVDEAQTLGPELLEQVRLLTNLETSTQKLLQIILIGQPELRELLGRPEMRQIAQRITGRFHLKPLSRAETAAYVRHRLRVAGCQTAIFTGSALRELYRRSHGIPRLINVVADRALLAAYTRDRTRVDGTLVRRAASEVFGRRLVPFAWPWAVAAAGIAAIALGTWGLVTDAGTRATEPPPAVPATTAAARPAPDPATNAPSGRTTFGSTAARAAAPDARPDGDGAEPPADAPSIVPLAELLADPAFRTDTDSAFATIFDLWEARYDPARGAPCDQAAQQRLRCLFRSEGSIGGLRQLNRPAILTLVDADGAMHQVVIERLDYRAATLTSGDRTATVDLSELTHYWFGDHLILWRPPAEAAGALVPGMQGPGVLWLRESLARLRGEDVGEQASPVYDPPLEADVRRYQRQKMLEVDGIVGEMTQLALTSDLGEPERPTLRGEY
ncbi:MAG TPA: AAA family ATPase [Gammaproteobacteria bacterium]